MTADLETFLSRRTFLQRSSTGLGALALTSLLKPNLFGLESGEGPAVPGALKHLHWAPKAKRIIYLFMSGAPSHLDLFDQWYLQHGSDVRRSVAALRELMQGAEGDSAFARLERGIRDSTVN